MGSLVSIPALADVAVLLLRLAIGVSFVLSGFFKLTRPDRRRRMEKSLGEASVPHPTAMAPVVSSLELLGGLSLLLGLFTALGACVVLVITAVALARTVVPKAEGEGIEKVENALFTPEGFLIPALLVLIAVGGGGISLDAAWL